MRLFAALFIALPLAAQQPAGQPKPRLELADTARRSTPTPATPPSVRRADAPARDSNVVAVRQMLRSDFVRKQTLLGITLYAPSFVAMVATKPVPATAAYLVMAGGSFFAAAELARDLRLTEGMELLATRAPLRGAAIGAGLQYALTGKYQYAAGIFFGSVLGTTAALTLGQRLSPGAAMASMFGSDAAAGLAMGTMYAFDAHYTATRARVAVGAGAALAGMQLGAMYGTYSPYHVTAGDISTLWTSAAIGAVAAGATVVDGHPGHQVTTLAMLGGSVVGLVAGDRLLVRRYDHTRAEGSLVGAGALAGGLMGAGVAVIIGSSARWNASTAALGAAGAAGGVWMAERWLGAHPDGGRKVTDRLTVSPQSLALAAIRAPGTYSLLTFMF
jgi:hypothetical protein